MIEQSSVAVGLSQ